MKLDGKKTILLVEDEEVNSIVVELKLKQIGYDVIIANTGEKAVQIALQNDEISLILMDIVLSSGIDGAEAARQILSKCNLPIIFHSIHPEKEFVERVNEIAHYGYVTKNSGEFVLKSSIEVALKLFDSLELNKSLQNIANLKHQQIEEESDNLLNLLSKMKVGVATVSLDGHFLSCNQGYCEILGYSKEELLKITIRDITVPEFIQYTNDSMKDLLEGKIENVVSDKKYITKNRGLIWGSITTTLIRNEDGTPKYFVGTIKDITVRKRLESELKESEDKFKILISNLQVGIIVQDFNSNIILSNPKAFELLGLTKEQMLGINSFDPSWNVIHEDNSPFPGNTHPVPISISTRKPVLGVVMGVYRPVTKDRVWILVDALPVLNEDSSLNHVVCTFTDITGQKNLKEKVKEQNKELIELNASKDKFFSIIAHDLKSPFNGFINITKKVTEEFDEMSLKELKKSTHELKVASNNLFKLLENLLTWSKIQRGILEFNPDYCIISYLVIQNLRIFKDSYSQKNIQIIHQIPENLYVVADTSMINSVIRNLISNAIKFTSKEGKIIIDCEDKEKEIVISIKDSGIGMDKDIIDKLFKIDQKTSRPGTDGESSSGLGLLLCKEFVEKHGGRIWVDSVVGNGSTFCFSLPKALK